VAALVAHVVGSVGDQQRQHNACLAGTDKLNARTSVKSTLTDPSIVVATHDQFSCSLGDDTIILDMRVGLYFSLDNVGAFVWQLVQQPTSVRELRQAVLGTFDVDPSVCERDLLALLYELSDKKLIEIRDAPAAA
jgi:hypothetical protein